MEGDGTTVTIVVQTNDEPRPPAGGRWLAPALTVLFVAWLMGWLWWLLAATTLLGAVVVGVHWYRRHRERIAAIAARAGQQHAWVLAGDPRGIYGATHAVTTEWNPTAARRV